MKLDLDPKRAEVAPRDASTLIVLRAGAAGPEVFCVERHARSAFLGGAIVFPGGKVDPSDAEDAWSDVVDEGRVVDRAVRIAACREALEEAAILPVTGAALDHGALLDLRARAASGEVTLPALLRERTARLALTSLVPLSRWVTPIAEARRYDTRFYLTRLPAGQVGAHDQRETTSSFWARPSDVLERFARGEVQLAPPTHRTLELLAPLPDVDAAFAFASAACLDPICPVMVQQDGAVALVLPGDPEHPVREARIAGPSRYVLRGQQFLPENPPGPTGR